MNTLYKLYKLGLLLYLYTVIYYCNNVVFDVCVTLYVQNINKAEKLFFFNLTWRNFKKTGRLRLLPPLLV